MVLNEIVTMNYFILIFFILSINTINYQINSFHYSKNNNFQFNK